MKRQPSFPDINIVNNITTCYFDLLSSVRLCKYIWESEYVPIQYKISLYSTNLFCQLVFEGNVSAAWFMFGGNVHLTPQDSQPMCCYV